MIHPTLSKSCLKYSIKKYFIDALQTGLGIVVHFDGNIVEPYLNDKTIKKWATILTGNVETSLFTLSESVLQIFLCTREDKEGYELSKFDDLITSLLVGKHDTIVTPFMAIPLYDSNITGRPKVGCVSLKNVSSGADGITSDGTYYKIMTLTLRYASTI